MTDEALAVAEQPTKKTAPTFDSDAGTKAIARQDKFSLVPRSLGEAIQFAEIMSRSELVPKDYRGKPDNILVAVQMGLDVGLSPMQAIQNIAVVNGRPCLWGDGFLAVVMAHPHFEDIEETWDDTTRTATCTVRRRGRKAVRESFSETDAKLAGLLGKAGPWTQYPRRMMKYRARGFACRDAFPDALRGIQLAEEVVDIVDAGTGAPAQRPTNVVDAPPPPPSATSRLVDRMRDMPKSDPPPAAQSEPTPLFVECMEAIANATTLAELDATAPLAKRLRGDERKRAYEAGANRGVELAAAEKGNG